MLNQRIPLKTKPAKTYASKWNQHRNWIWRLRGKALDGLVVTLGRYETTLEAEADLVRMTRSGGYRDLVLQPLEPTPEAPPE
jgi:hypothetical protein